MALGPHATTHTSADGDYAEVRNLGLQVLHFLRARHDKLVTQRRVLEDQNTEGIAQVRLLNSASTQGSPLPGAAPPHDSRARHLQEALDDSDDLEADAVAYDHMRRRLEAEVVTRRERLASLQAEAKDLWRQVEEAEVVKVHARAATHAAREELRLLRRRARRRSQPSARRASRPSPAPPQRGQPGNPNQNTGVAAAAQMIRALDASHAVRLRRLRANTVCVSAVGVEVRGQRPNGHRFPATPRGRSAEEKAVDAQWAAEAAFRDWEEVRALEHRAARMRRALATALEVTNAGDVGECGARIAETVHHQLPAPAGGPVPGNVLGRVILTLLEARRRHLEARTAALAKEEVALIRALAHTAGAESDRPASMHARAAPTRELFDLEAKLATAQTALRAAADRARACEQLADAAHRGLEHVAAKMGIDAPSCADVAVRTRERLILQTSAETLRLGSRAPGHGQGRQQHEPHPDQMRAAISDAVRLHAAGPAARPAPGPEPGSEAVGPGHPGRRNAPSSARVRAAMARVRVIARAAVAFRPPAQAGKASPGPRADSVPATRPWAPSTPAHGRMASVEELTTRTVGVVEGALLGAERLMAATATALERAVAWAEAQATSPPALVQAPRLSSSPSQASTIATAKTRRTSTASQRVAPGLGGAATRRPSAASSAGDSSFKGPRPARRSLVRRGALRQAGYSTAPREKGHLSARDRWRAAAMLVIKGPAAALPDFNVLQAAARRASSMSFSTEAEESSIATLGLNVSVHVPQAVLRAACAPPAWPHNDRVPPSPEEDTFREVGEGDL